LAGLISGPRRLSVAYSWAGSRRRRWGRGLVRVLILARILGRALIRILTLVSRLARILGRALIRTLILILRRTIGRGNLSILCIGRRPRRAPVTRLAWGWCLLGSLLRRRNQGWSQREARAQSSGKQPLQTISTLHIHFFNPLPRRDARSVHQGFTP
jgi:hypothetical protein